MKKNLLTIIIIAVSVVNLILSALLVFSIVPSMNKTNKLVTQVASIIDLELESPKEGGAANISVEDIGSYNIEDQLTINLKNTEGDSKTHYAVMNVTLSLNKTSKDYEKLEPTVSTNESIIKEFVNDAFSNYNKDEVHYSKNAIKEEILIQLKDYFNSDFIINISFSNFIVS